MPLKVKKQNNESSQNVVRRFSQKLRRSGILLQARKNRFHQKPSSRQMLKHSAIRRAVKKAEYAKMKKMGA